MGLKNRKLVFALAGGGAIVLAAGIWAYLSGIPVKLTAPPPAPHSYEALGGDFSLEGLAGAKTAKIADYRGKVVLLNFWAGWCGPCLEEMPSLYALYGKYRGRGFEVLGIDMDDDPQEGLAALKRAAGNAPFALYKGADSKLAERFTITGLPFTVILDREGKIRFARPGEVDWAAGDATHFLEGLL